MTTQKPRPKALSGFHRDSVSGRVRGGIFGTAGRSRAAPDASIAERPNAARIDSGESLDTNPLKSRKRETTMNPMLPANAIGKPTIAAVPIACNRGTLQ